MRGEEPSLHLTASCAQYSILSILTVQFGNAGPRSQNTIHGKSMCAAIGARAEVSRPSTWPVAMHDVREQKL